MSFHGVNRGNVTITNGNVRVSSSSVNDAVELHIHAPDTFDWSKISNKDVVSVIVHGDVKGNISATNITANQINGDVLNSVNVTGKINGNVKAVNVNY